MALFLLGLCVSFLSVLTIVLSTETDNTDNTDNTDITMYMQVPTKDVCNMSSAVNGFSFDMLEKVSEEHKNMVFSPFSIYSALGMLSLAARRNTKKEIISALKWDTNKSIDTLEALKNIHTKLANENLSGDVKIEIVNNGWVANDTNVLSEFEEQLKKYFNVKLGVENFAEHPEASRKKINNWVSNHTGDLIKDLFPEEAINADTKLALANAVYFKGSWLMPFNENTTRDLVFHTSDGTTKIVPFMYQKNLYRTAYYRNVQFLEMSYRKETFSMLFAMPRMKSTPAGDDITDVNVLINEMNDDNLLKEALTRMKVHECNVYVPKFKIKKAFKLESHLKSLGIKDAFDMAAANLSGINGREELYVSSAMHKAFIQVDEQGTKAAAATGIVAMLRSMSPTVMLNRPFLFFILDKSCDSIIFAGKIVNPLAWL